MNVEKCYDKFVEEINKFNSNRTWLEAQFKFVSSMSIPDFEAIVLEAASKDELQFNEIKVNSIHERVSFSLDYGYFIISTNDFTILKDGVEVPKRIDAGITIRWENNKNIEVQFDLLNEVEDEEYPYFHSDKKQDELGIDHDWEHPIIQELKESINNGSFKFNKFVIANEYTDDGEACLELDITINDKEFKGSALWLIRNFVCELESLANNFDQPIAQYNFILYCLDAQGDDAFFDKLKTVLKIES